MGRRLFRDSRRKEAHLYKVGDKVVYPHHGAGTVVKREKREILGEKQMYVKAKKILASELMYAKTMDEDECAEWLEEVLATGGNGKKKATASKKKAVAATA